MYRLQCGLIHSLLAISTFSGLYCTNAQLFPAIMGRSLRLAGISQSQTHTHWVRGRARGERRGGEESSAKEEGKLLARVWMVVIFSGALPCLSLSACLPARSPEAAPSLLTASPPPPPPPLSFLKLPVLPNDIWLRQHDANATKIPLFFRSLARCPVSAC